MPKPMTKEKALRHILWEYQRDKGSKTAFNKTLRALEVLGIGMVDGIDTRLSILRELGYIDADGKPYERYT